MAQTRTDIRPEEIEQVKIQEKKNVISKKRRECKARGGIWDESTQTCLNVPIDQQLKDFSLDPTFLQPRPEKQESPKEPEVDIKTPEYFTDKKGNITGITLSDGKTFLGLTPKEVKMMAQRDMEDKIPIEGLQPAGTAKRKITQQREAERLAGQIGQTGQLPISPTGLDVGESVTAGLINAIPRALGYGVTGGIAGAIGGSAVAPGIGTAGGAVIGAVGGFITGITSSMLSNFKSQRTDTTTAQQRVLDEGKQNLNDWATLAATDPANRAVYVSRFNQQLALIDQAYRQMKLDTSRDIAKFETALPNLAEFETFYSQQGEKDFLISKMKLSLGVQQDPEYIYQMAELKERMNK